MELLEEILASGRTPEAVCADAPEVGGDGLVHGGVFLFRDGLHELVLVVDQFLFECRHGRRGQWLGRPVLGDRQGGA